MMTCEVCGSRAVSFRGRFDAPSHTECSHCGARDCEKREPALAVVDAAFLREFGGTSKAEDQGGDATPEEWAEFRRLEAAEHSAYLAELD